MQHSQKTRVILISSVTPSLYSAGHIILHRHLVDRPEIELIVLETEPRKPSIRKLARRGLACLARTKFCRYAQDMMSLWKGGWIDAELPVPEETDIATVVMTVAHGDAFCAAIRYANRYDLPLVTFFHDWWPDIPRIHRIFRPILERSFLHLYHASSLALCVGPRMREELGAHANSKILFPIPSAAHLDGNQSSFSSDKGRSFRLLHAGNLTDYGPVMMSALEEFKDHPYIRLEVRGNSSAWPDAIKNEMSERGLLHPYAPRKEFDSWLRMADAFLVIQSFDGKYRRIMQTNFLSKLVEFAQQGKPLIIWGPPYGSAIKWARETGCGIVVDQENPECLKDALESLCADRSEQERLAAAAKELAAGPFGPERIQSDFLRWLHEVAV